MGESYFLGGGVAVLAFARKEQKTSPIMGDGVLPRRGAVSYGINPRNVNSENVS